jgi:hypothetical protein
MAPNGEDDNLTPIEISPAGGYAYTGSPLFASLGSNINTEMQSFLLSTTGLYAWGDQGICVPNGLTPGEAFAAINLPAGITPDSVLQMSATYNSLAIVTLSGQVWVSTTQTNMNGDNVAGLPGSHWARVLTSAAGNPVLTGVTDLRIISPVAAIAYVPSTGIWYTWGTRTYLGDGSGPAARGVATPMTAPFVGVPKMLAMTGNGTNPSYFALNPANNRIYALGENEFGQLGRNNTTDQTGWVIVQNAANTGDLTNVDFISANDQDGWDENGAVGCYTSNDDLLLWGSNSGLMIGQLAATTQRNLPTRPLGFTFGTDIPVYLEVGGHTSAYIKECADRYCYVGHKVDGSMGDGVGTSSNVSSWDCINTPQALICGASSFDGGDVPMSFEATNAAAHYYQCPSVIRFGTLNPTANNGSPGNVAPQADNMGSNGDGLEEDGVATLTTYAGSGTYSFTTSAFNNTGSTANVYAWVDWNGDGLFSASEIQTTTVPSGAAPVNRTFTWNAIAAVTCGKKYVRLRITNDALTDNVGTTSIDERSRGPALGGEV